MKQSPSQPQANYMSIIPQSDDEKFEMYMKLPPEQVAKMLVSCNRALDGVLPKVVESPSEDPKEIDKIIEHLTNEFSFHSSGTAMLVMKLINGYKGLEEINKRNDILWQQDANCILEQRKQLEELTSKLKEGH